MALRLKNEPLKGYTTFKIGGTADVLSIPQDIDEIKNEIDFCLKNNVPYKILGNGSNLLISDKGVKGFVISLKKACNKLSIIKRNIIEVGSGVLLQPFINFAIENNLSGNELLFSIPGTIGGALYMNAGIGSKNAVKASISDYLCSVTILDLDNESIRVLKKGDCKFDYRKSIFQEKKNWIILSAQFDLPSQPKQVGLAKKKERMQRVLVHQDRKYPNAGSIFRYNYSRFAAALMRGKRYGEAMYSKKNGNWIINLGEAKATHVKKLINMAIFINFLFTLKFAVLEIEIWE